MLATTMLAGCGGGSDPAPQSQQTTNTTTTRHSLKSADDPDLADSNPKIVPASGISQGSKKVGSGEDDSELDLTQPEKDSPEWFILQITRLKLRPLGDSVDAFSQSTERQAELRRERNQQLVDLATEAIARTHKEKDQSKVRVFDLAVHHLLEAELQLALTGDKEHIDAIYEHASSLYERNPKSKAAVEAGQVLISFARLNAQRFGQQEPKWLEEYGRLARQFAKHFPQEERQAIPVLFAAGQSCEYHGLTAEAIQCFAMVREAFPESSSAERITPILRRLNLKGQPLQLAGPTIGGGFLNAEELLGRPLLVVFWTTQAQPFVRQLSTLQELLSQIDPNRLNVVSVNLDDDDNESAVQTFLESNRLDWPTIFQTDPEKRGWNNPVAAYYGIQSVPLYWVVSSKGNVVETATNVQQIEPLLQKLMTAKKPVEESPK
ncbi:MAG: TlpA family protein disulfide reductase [Planctomycetaceae bacterium]|nr:TlpA family protein disulfide reductase [Planctomycetaceae bacterium]